jgi:hypothetical protein
MASKGVELPRAAERVVARLVEAMARGPDEARRKMGELVSQFPKYSVLNALLIGGQRPHASMVRGKRQWEAMGAKVRKGARGIAIWAPRVRSGDKAGCVSFTVRKVYDLKDLEAAPAGLRVWPSPRDDANRAGELDQVLCAWLVARGCQVVEGSPWSNQPCEGATNGKTVWVRPDLRGVDPVAVLAHEVGHVRLHFPRRKRGDHKIHVDDGRDRGQRCTWELQAELFAYFLLSIHRIDSAEGAGAYLSSWEASKDVLLAEVPRILAAVSGVSRAMREAWLKQQAPRESASGSETADVPNISSQSETSQRSPRARCASAPRRARYDSVASGSSSVGGWELYGLKCA